MIPKLVHFIFGLASDFGGKPFSFIHYMAIRSVVVCNPGYRIRFYCKYEPQGLFWDVAKRYVELVQVEPPHAIHGNRLHHVAHQADVLRLQYLIEQGGIYLDLDTITVRSFDDLLAHQVVMGVQGRGDRVFGLCNAVMMAAPNAPFMVRWLGTYSSFRSKGRDDHWDEHSVRIPMQLARAHPQELTVLDRGAFFHPSAEKQGLLDLFVEDLRFPSAYCHHLWEGMAWSLIRNIDERNVGLIDTSYNRMARRFLDDDLPRFQVLRAQEFQQLLQAPVRLNLGCGSNKIAGWLNVDSQPAASPDLLFNIGASGWPMADDSVDEVVLSHVLEHVGESFETVMKELYRVCRDGALVNIRLPHPRHDWFLTDPTHNRALLPESFRMLDAEACRNGLITGDTASALAVYWKIDFVVDGVVLVPGTEFRRLHRTRLLLALGYPYLKNLAKRLLRRDAGAGGSTADSGDGQLMFLSRYLNNVVGEIRVRLRVRKSGPSARAVAPGAAALGSADIATLGRATG